MKTLFSAMENLAKAAVIPQVKQRIDLPGAALLQELDEFGKFSFSAGFQMKQGREVSCENAEYQAERLHTKISNGIEDLQVAAYERDVLLQALREVEKVIRGVIDEVGGEA